MHILCAWRIPVAISHNLNHYHWKKCAELPLRDTEAGAVALMKFNKNKCKILYLEGKKPTGSAGWGPTAWGEALLERPWSLVDSKLDASPLPALAARVPAASCARLAGAQQSVEGSDYPSLLSIPFGLPQYRKDTHKLEWVQQKATKIVMGLEHSHCGERLRDQGLLSLEKRKFQGDLMAVLQYRQGGYWEDGTRFFSPAC